MVDRHSDVRLGGVEASDDDEAPSPVTVRRHRTVTARILAVLVLPLSMLLFVTMGDAVRSADDADHERRAGSEVRDGGAHHEDG